MARWNVKSNDADPVQLIYTQLMYIHGTEAACKKLQTQSHRILQTEISGLIKYIMTAPLHWGKRICNVLKCLSSLLAHTHITVELRSYGHMTAEIIPIHQ